LEGIEERIVPAGMTQPMAPMIEEVQQELNMVVQIIEQDIAQVEALVVRHMEQILGIPTSRNSASGSGAGSGSGRGSGATTTHSVTNRQLHSGPQQAGNGSGSGVMGWAKDNNPMTGVSKIHALTSSGSLLPAGSGSSSGLITVYTWDPHRLGSGTGHGSGNLNYDFSNYHNWLINGQPQNGTSGTIPDDPKDEAIFNGSVSNIQCIVDINTSEGYVFLRNGYTATFTISAGISFSISNFADNGIGLDDFVVAFAGPNAVESFAAGLSFLGNFSSEAGGKTTVAAGASVAIGMQSGLNQSTTSPLTISGTVSIGPISANSGRSTFKLTNSSADINVNTNGSLIFSAPTNDQTLVDNTGTAALISNNGTVALQETPGEGGAIIAAQLANHATLKAAQGGLWDFTRADANNHDVSMDAGKITMADNVSLNCTHGYNQSGGTLEVADNDGGALYVNAGGVANFAGGKIVFDSKTGYGNLLFYSVIFNGVEIDMRINGINNTCDYIHCFTTSKISIQGNSKLVVTATNPVVKGSGITWTLIQPDVGDKILGDFLPANITLPKNVVETVGALPNSWKCNS
jgi:hypothetical protein